MPKTNCLSVLTCIFPTFSQYIIFSISIQSRSFDKMLKFSIMPFSVSKVGSFLRIKQTQLYSIEEIKECWGCQDWKENYINNWYIHLKKKKSIFFVIMTTTLMENQEQVKNQSILNKLKMKSPYITHALYSLIETSCCYYYYY